jgi:hypothetical protein
LPPGFDSWAQLRARLESRVQGEPSRLRLAPIPGENSSLVAQFTWEGEEDWWATGVMEVANKDLVIRELTIFANPVRHLGRGLTEESWFLKTPSGGITSSTLRKVPVGRILAGAKAEFEDVETDLAIWEALGLPMPSPEAQKLARDAAQKVLHSRLKRGRKGYPDDHYRRIAFAYLDLLKQGISRGILRSLATQEGKRAGRAVPVETVRDWVHQARLRGFLTKGSPGRAGGAPGPRLYGQEPVASVPPRETDGKRQGRA